MTVTPCPQCGELTGTLIDSVCPGCNAENKDNWAQIVNLMRWGHTKHCAQRQVWGDGECECKGTNTIRQDDVENKIKEALEIASNVINNIVSKSWPKETAPDKSAQELKVTKIFMIKYPASLGPNWLCLDNLKTLLFSNTAIKHVPITVTEVPANKLTPWNYYGYLHGIGE